MEKIEEKKCGRELPCGDFITRDKALEIAKACVSVDYDDTIKNLTKVFKGEGKGMYDLKHNIANESMTVKEYLEKTYEKDNPYTIRKEIICNDGFCISVQGGTHFHWCTPREHCNFYFEVELGYPSERDDSIMKYAEDKDNPTITIYGYVPIDLVEMLIAKHKGIKEQMKNERDKPAIGVL